MDIAREIKEKTNILELFQCLGLKANRNNAIICPFHNEKTPSLKPYKNGKGFRCFGCGASGTIIDFAMLYWNCDFKNAIIKLNDYMKLGLAIGEKPTLQEYRKHQEIERKRNILQAEKNRIIIQYDTALCNFIHHDKNKKLYKPTEITESLHPLFIEALQKIGYSEYLLDCMEIEGDNFEREHNTRIRY